MMLDFILGLLLCCALLASPVLLFVVICLLRGIRDDLRSVRALVAERRKRAEWEAFLRRERQ